MDRQAYLRALEETQRVLSGETIDLECVCLGCGQIYGHSVTVEFGNDPDVWRRAGYLVILCPGCLFDKPGRKRRVKEDEVIKVAEVNPHRAYSLYYAMDDTVWRKVEEDITKERGDKCGTTQ